MISKLSGRSCLVSVYGPGNVLAAIASVRSHGESLGARDPDRVVVLVHPPGESGASADASAAVVERLISSQGWQAPILLTSEAIAKVVPSASRLIRYEKAIQWFVERVGERFDEFHFAHDMVGRVPELAMNAYPDAVRITYGDALGSVYDAQYFMALANGATISEARQAVAGRPRRRFRDLPRAAFASITRLALGAPRQFAPDVANLVLPMDQTGVALADTPFTVVPRELVRRIVGDCQRVLPELDACSEGILTGCPEPHYVLLLENYADAEITSFEDELSMYEMVVRRYVPSGATVLLKTHPLAVSPLGDTLRQRLATGYVCRMIPEALGRYPMELWERLVTSCEIISMLSYCGISLAYLYGKSTIYPVDSELIEEFFPRRSWDRMRDSDTLYRGQLEGLRTWDGTGILWKGTA